MRLSGNVHKRLAAIGEDIARAQRDIAVLDEQIAHAQGVADEAVTRAVVSETPLADRERHTAESDLGRIRRQRDETAERINALRQEQDRLLERLLEGSDG